MSKCNNLFSTNSITEEGSYQAQSIRPFKRSTNCAKSSSLDLEAIRPQQEPLGSCLYNGGGKLDRPMR
jgi:hypothetical protein